MVPTAAQLVPQQERGQVRGKRRVLVSQKQERGPPLEWAPQGLIGLCLRREQVWV